MNLVAIGDLVEAVEKRDPRANVHAHTFTYVDIGAVSQTTKAIEEPQDVLCAEAPSRARQVIECNDVLVSTVRPNLNAVAKVPEALSGAIASTGFSVLRANPRKLHASYLYHWVRTEAFINSMMMQATGQSYPAVSDKIVKTSHIPLPPLDEQRRIAGILDQADSLRRLRARALDKLNTLGQAIFHEMFGHSLPLIPIAELVEQVEKRDPRTNTHSDSFKYVDIGSVSHETKRIENAKKVVCAEAPSRARQVIVADDILVSTVRPNLNAVAWVDDQLDGAIASTGFTVLRPQKNKLSAAYLYYWVRSEAFVSKMILKAAGQSYPAVSDKIVKASEIPFPSLTEQERFAAIISKLHENSSLKIEALEKFDALFTSLQHRAFRGEL